MHKWALAEVAGVLYVEHDLLEDAFPAARIQTLAMLSAQIAISIENSDMYAEVSDVNPCPLHDFAWMSDWSDAASRERY